MLRTALPASDTKLQTYLRRIGWEAETFPDNQLEAMLAAGCLRYLGGLEEISFVLGLASEIRRRYEGTMPLSLQQSTGILGAVASQLEDNRTLPIDSSVVYKQVNEAQKALTKRDLPL